MVTKPTADLLVLAGAVHTMEAASAPVTALAVRDGMIAAVAGPDGVSDLLATWRGPKTVIFDEPGLVVLPAFVDTHNHLMLTACDVLGVPVSEARDISQLVGLVRERAERTPPGQWVVSGAAWHELQLAERRLPTATELDGATTDHPVLVLRGGHNGVLNTAGLRAAGIDRNTPDMPGGFIARDPAGHPTGWVQGGGLVLARSVLPPLPEEGLAAGLAQTAARYAAHGLGTVRDPAVTPQEWRTYVKAQAAGQLSVRSHAMIFSPREAIEAAGSIDAYLDSLEEEGIKPGIGDGLLRLWGLKFVLDGGVEAAALEQPYAGRPDYHGELKWSRDDLAHALATCVRRGWPVGTHVMGDRGIALLLDAIRDASEQVGPIPAGRLVIEHGGLIGDRIADAVAMGVHVTAQQALLDGLGQALIGAWGRERTAALFPWRKLVDSGAWVSAGTDHPIGPLNPMRAIHGMTTRETPAGVLGPEQAISRAEALRLYTVTGARLLGAPATGTLVPGAPADLAIYSTDPLTCPDAELFGLTPAATVVAGRLAYRSS
ncbi:amidohydrolase [Streptomyces sp. NPDC050759]|uniref:amidohydrolase n=1 Tax=Streptomyces sp. NPDC050759 TaxID=3365635 RepID=UPI0037BA8955